VAIAAAPTVVSNQTYGQWRIAQRVTAPGCKFTHVGTVVVLANDNTTVPLGGTFDAWYCPQTHSLLLNITDNMVGGPT
jgi:hypothetical protein